MNKEKITLQEYFYEDFHNNKLSLALDTLEQVVNALTVPMDLHSMVQDILFDKPEGVQILDDDKVVSYYISNNESTQGSITMALYEDEDYIGITIEKTINEETLSFQYCQEVENEDSIIVFNAENIITFGETNDHVEEKMNFEDLDEFIQILCLIGDHCCDFEVE